MNTENTTASAYIVRLATAGGATAYTTLVADAVGNPFKGSVSYDRGGPPWWGASCYPLSEAL